MVSKTNNIAMAVHGGASNTSIFIRKNTKSIEKGLEQALLSGHQLLKKGSSALDAVEHAVMLLEDNPFFNAGRGSALNSLGEVEMDASIMDGRTLKAGAVSLLRNIKNPVMLARQVMMKTKHVFLSGEGALQFARDRNIAFEPDRYFITDQQYQEFEKIKARENKAKNKKNETKNGRKLKERKEKHKTNSKILNNPPSSGTVGAVALDKKGNLAAATSTGGINYSLPGRVGDSCIIGAGCYAHNKICAISGTGSGEVLITNVVAHTIAMVMKLKKISLEDACEYVIYNVKHKKNQEGIGVIGIDPNGNIGISYNTQIMKRAWITTQGEIFIKIW